MTSWRTAKLGSCATAEYFNPRTICSRMLQPSSTETLDDRFESLLAKLSRSSSGQKMPGNFEASWAFCARGLEEVCLIDNPNLPLNSVDLVQSSLSLNIANQNVDEERTRTQISNCLIVIHSNKSRVAVRRSSCFCVYKRTRMKT